MFTRSWQPLLLIHLASYVPAIVLGGLLAALGALTGSVALIIVLGVVAVVVFVAAVLIAQGVSIYYVTNDAAGRQVALGEAFRFGVSRAPALLGWGILAGLMVVVGLILLFFPGLYLGLVFTATLTGVIMYERGAIDRCFSLFNRRFWPTVGRVLLYFLAAGIYQGVVQFVVQSAFGADSPIGQAIIQILIIPLALVAVGVSVVTYAELRHWEAPGQVHTPAAGGRAAALTAGPAPSVRRRTVAAPAPWQAGSTMSTDGLFDIDPPDGDDAGPGDAPAAPGAPLAVRMRPRSLDEVVGQRELLRAGAPLRRLLEGGAPASVLLHGPPGTGKTTLARLMAGAGGGGRRFVALSALSAGVKELRAVIDEARVRRDRSGTPTVLFIDEVHRFSKTQQDALLGAVEDRVVLLVAATTENPSFSVVSPLLSRSLVLGLQSLEPDDLRELLRRAVASERGLNGAVTLAQDGEEALVRLSAGDARRALTALEAAADGVMAGGGEVVDLDAVERAVTEVAVRYDRAGDQHYDVISAFIKSIRGSDPDAALHYLARMIVAGEDARFIARRLMVHASEDIGLADPTALPAATAAAQVVQLVGMPEARLALAQVTLHLATAPKSNSVITAIDAAMSDVRAGAVGCVPAHLRDGHYAGAQKLGNAVGYRYPHDTAGRRAHPAVPAGRPGRARLLRARLARRRADAVRAAAQAAPRGPRELRPRTAQPVRSVSPSAPIAEPTGVKYAVQPPVPPAPVCTPWAWPSSVTYGPPESPSRAQRSAAVSPDCCWPPKFTTTFCRETGPQLRPDVDPNRQTGVPTGATRAPRTGAPPAVGTAVQPPPTGIAPASGPLSAVRAPPPTSRASGPDVHVRRAAGAVARGDQPVRAPVGRGVPDRAAVACRR